MKFQSRLEIGIAIVFTMLATASIASASGWWFDFGSFTQYRLERQAKLWFGIKKPLLDSSTENIQRVENQHTDELVDKARSLKVRIVTRNAGQDTDMMVPWPNSAAPTHLVTCVEEGRFEMEDGRLQPGVQRIELRTGAVETILRGMSRCDGIRGTEWGTILATEETGDGAAYEILSPLTTTEEIVVDRGGPGGPAVIVEADGVTPSSRIAKRPALATVAWEGLSITREGVVFFGDELRPGTAAPDVDGGALFKFVPDLPWSGEAVDQLAESPFVAGQNFALQVSCRDDRQQYGQGCEVGNGAWLAVGAANARVDADAAGATGYYRPEDLHTDPAFEAPEESPDAIRFCWTNTGNTGASNYGEVICGVDVKPLAASADQRTVVVNRLLEGDTELNAPDNYEFQSRTGIHYVIEDNRNGDIWACLRDGLDRDLKSDGCIRVLSLKDQSAEPSGFVFDATGTRAWVAIQHSNDDQMPLFDGFRTDDVLEITGFKVYPHMIRTDNVIEGAN